MSTTDQVCLPDALNTFAVMINSNEAIRPLLINWEPLLLLEETDSGDKHHLQIKRSRIENVGAGDIESATKIIIRGDRMTLGKMFRGSLHPAQAHANGALEIVANASDQAKLDALGVVLWGV